MTSMSSLPLPDLPFQGALAFDARQQAKLPPIAAKRPPKQAPNVLLILLDDVGFGASSAFGGPVSMPTAERLAEGGLKYTRFHTTALCSPTRAALLSGRNHHQVAMGHITETATPSPGYRSTARTRRRRWPRSCARTATTRPSSASVTRSRSGSPGPRVRSTTGRRSPASSGSTGSSGARRTSGRRPWSTGSARSSRRATRATT